MVPVSSDPESTVERPYPDEYLLAYSDEHVVYEIDMLFRLAQVFANPKEIRASDPAEAHSVKNALIESCAIHVRNIIEFLHPKNVRRTDVVAADFLPLGEWDRIKPAISEDLSTALDRANTEIAHLTSQRIAGAPPKKAWNFQALVGELHPVLQLWAFNALTNRLSARVVEAFRQQNP